MHSQSISQVMPLQKNSSRDRRQAGTALYLRGQKSRDRRQAGTALHLWGQISLTLMVRSALAVDVTKKTQNMSGAKLLAEQEHVWCQASC